MQLLRRNACCCGIVALGVEACLDDGSRCKDCKCRETTGSLLRGWQGTMWLSFCGRSLSFSGLRIVLPYHPAITLWSIHKSKTCHCGEPHMGGFFFFCSFLSYLPMLIWEYRSCFVSRSWKENVLKNENAEEKSIVKWVRKGTTWSSRKGKTMITVKIYWFPWFNKGEEWIEACGKLWGQRN